MHEHCDGNEHAFAAVRKDWTQCGLTKREYFAAAALQGILAGAYSADHSWDADLAARLAVEHADDLILALNHAGGA